MLYQPEADNYCTVVNAARTGHDPGALHRRGEQEDVVLPCKARLHAATEEVTASDLTRKLVQFSSVQSLSRVRLCHPMNRSMPGLPVHHQLPESTQTHVVNTPKTGMPFRRLELQIQVSDCEMMAPIK